MNSTLTNLDFSTLVKAIQQTHEQMADQAGRAVNVSLTLRNWMIGFYIQEYAQRGTDRAKYGQGIFERLSQELKKNFSINYHPRELRRCRDFYTTYPQIRGTVSPELNNAVFKNLFGVLPSDAGAADTPRIRGAASPELTIPPHRLVRSLSFSHFAELIPIDDPLKRAFYEIECMRGNWSVRELKRQIGSLYFERSGLSTNKEKLAEMVQAGVEQAGPKLAIRDPYIFEFLGIKSREVMAESDLEDALLDKLQDFLLELGHGFCFEARQKRILIGNTHGFVDLVFYHRVLKCHVLVELKVDTFTHENLGQLNTYPGYFMKIFAMTKQLYQKQTVAIKIRRFLKIQTVMSKLMNFTPILCRKFSPFGRVTLTASAVLQAACSRFTTASRPAPCGCGQIDS